MANRMDISLDDAKIHIHRVGYKRYDEEKKVNTHLPVIAAAVRKHMHDRAVCAFPSADELVAIKAAIAAYEADKQRQKTRIVAKPPVATQWKFAAKLRMIGI